MFQDCGKILKKKKENICVSQPDFVKVYILAASV